MTTSESAYRVIRDMKIRLDHLKEIQDEKEEQWRANAQTAFQRGMKAADHRKWIPCSERLPEKTGWYQCTVKENVGGWVADFFFWNGEWFDNTRNMIDRYDIRSRSTGEPITGREYEWTDKITAWMPLPEPYKEEEE